MIDITLPDSVLFRGLFVTIGSVLVFYGSVYLLVYTNLGKKLGFLLAGTALFGWTTLNSLLFVMYAPRGPRPSIIDGLNFFEVRVIAFAFMVGSAILFTMFLVALNRFEQADSDTA
ncbi:MAG: sugar transferase [Acidimicrobiia bacterium]|nr:sugar transferase [Acidimicrobiia bacterium]